MIGGMRLLAVTALILLSACAGLKRPASLTEAPPAGPAAQPAAIRPPDRPGDLPRPAAAPAAATTAPATGTLGTTVASLDASEPGLWLRTPLVKARAPGSVAYQGRTVTADLIPLEGPATAGSRASLQLMQALGAPLTALPELTVSR